MAILRQLLHRCYSNFMMPSRLSEYTRLLETFQRHDFESLTLHDFAERKRSGQVNDRGRYLLLRHDVDTDVETTSAMWRIEQRYGISATRFFRLSTINVALMRQIEQAGGEAGYHYEEIATFAKQYRLCNPHLVRMRLSEIRDRFRTNLFRLRAATGLELCTAAAHGDFANRRLKIANTEILADREFRAAMGVSLEAYDDVIEANLTARHCDRPYPQWWAPQSPEHSAVSQPCVVLILLHPRHWRANIRCNVREDIHRLWDGVRLDWVTRQVARS